MLSIKNILCVPWCKMQEHACTVIQLQSISECHQCLLLFNFNKSSYKWFRPHKIKTIRITTEPFTKYYELCFSFTVFNKNIFVRLKTKKIYIIVMTSNHFTVCKFLLRFRCEWSIGSMWVKEVTKPIGPRSLNSGSQLWLFICCKPKLKKNIYIFWKNISVFEIMWIICRKNVFIWKKSFILKNFFTEKTFFSEKNINKNIKK